MRKGVWEWPLVCLPACMDTWPLLAARRARRHEDDARAWVRGLIGQAR